MKMIGLRRTGSMEHYMWYIYNKLGCTDTAYAYTYFVNGDMRWSNWVTYHTLMHLAQNEYVPGMPLCETRESFIDKVSHRTVLDIELMFDLDEKGQFYSIKHKSQWIYNELCKLGHHPTVHFTGSKSYHISVLIPHLRGMAPHQRSKLKSDVFAFYGTDLMMASERKMIALEGRPHYKSLIRKKEVVL